MHVLEAKINLFELVVGELDMILGRVDDDFDFENEGFRCVRRRCRRRRVRAAARRFGQRARRGEMQLSAKQGRRRPAGG